MCNNLIVLYIFIILKVIVIFILPIVIYLLRKKEFVKYLIAIDLFFLAFFLFCNVFNINKCVYNSNPEGIKRTNNENKIKVYNELHPIDTSYADANLKSKASSKTYTGKTLHYYNLNRKELKDLYFECKDQKIYFNSFGSSLTAFSTAISTLYNRDISPITLFEYYKTDNYDMCKATFSIDDLYNTLMKRYGAIKVSQIDSSKVASSIKEGGLVIAQLSAVEDSKLTCDSDYIIIYSIGLDGKYMIADPALPSKSYICPYSSEAYGNIIDSENMNNSWKFEDIDNEAIRYYLVRM